MTVTRVKTEVHICDRCAFGTEKPATEHRIFSIDEDYYELDVCEKHAEMFDRDLSGWTRLAAEIDGPKHARKSQFFTKERQEETRRINEARDRIARQAHDQEFAQRRSAEIELEEALTEERNARQTIAGAMRWSITKHARERIKEYGYSYDEVLQAAAFPTHHYQDSSRRAREVIYYADTCRIAVDEHTHTVITVLPRVEYDFKPPIDQLRHPERTAL
jgi:hypothetical protein